jgi:hypothetical protein
VTEPRLNLGPLEYRLLDLVAEFAVPLQALPDGEIEPALNRRSLGASNAELARALAVLSDLDLVWLTTEDEDDARLDAVAIERLISLPAIDGVIYKSHGYGLTAAGGVEWERAARPDWNRYVEYRTSPSEDDVRWEHSIICADPSMAERYLGFQRAVWLEPGDLIEASITRDVVRPWEATYWKTLPEAHRIRYLSASGRSRYPSREEIARSDFPTGGSRWHDDPWEASGIG